MKILLSLLGSFAVTTSGGAGFAFAVKTQPAIQKVELETQILKLKSEILENEISYQFKNFQQSYYALSATEKNNLSLELGKIPSLNQNVIDQYLLNSKNEFIKNNQDSLKVMYFLSQSMEKLSALSLPTTQLDFDWSMLNPYLNLRFTASNDYSISTGAYGPSQWWNIWEWGLKVDFHEGIMNIMKVVNMLCETYGNSFLPNIDPLINLLHSGKDFFNYLVNIDQHGNDKIEVLNNLVIKTERDFKNSKLPFTEKVDLIFKLLKTVLLFIDHQKPVSEIAPLIRKTIEEKLDTTLEELGSEINGVLDNIVNIMDTTKTIIDILNTVLPGFVSGFIIPIISSISSQMILADKNDNGVYIKFQQFLIPLGFNPR